MSLGDARIGDLVVEAGLLSRKAVEDVVARGGGGRRLLSHLLVRGVADERTLANILAKRHGTPAAIVTASTIDLRALALLPETLCRERCVLPIHDDGHALTVLTTQPEDDALLSELVFFSGRRIVPIAAIGASLGQLVEVALEQKELGHSLCRGGTQAPLQPYLALTDASASLPQKVDISAEERDRMARAIIEALDDKSPSTKHHVAAVRLKQVMVKREAVEVPKSSKADEYDDEDTELLRPPPLQRQTSELLPTVVVVDDDDAIRKMLCHILAQDEVDVVEANTGKKAIEVLKAHRPSLVLLDAMLPEVHGFDICRQMKASEAYRHIPVIILSANYRGIEQSREILERVGADHFVPKPFEMRYLRSLIADILKRPPQNVPRSAAVEQRRRQLETQYEALAHASRTIEALQCIDAWLTLDPFDGRAWLERGNQCARLGDLVAGMTAFEAASVYAPDLVHAHIGLALCCDRMGFYRRSIKAWNRAATATNDPVLQQHIQTALQAVMPKARPS